MLVKRMRYAVWRGFKGQMDDVLAVLRRRTKDADDDALLAEIAAVLAPLVLRVPITRTATQAWLLGARSANEDFSISPGVGATSPDLDRYIEDTLRPSVAGIHEFTSQRVLHIVGGGLAAGFAIPTIMEEVEGQRRAGVFSMPRAEGIGFYEANHAFIHGRRSAVATHARRKDKRLQKRWITVGDIRVEAMCEQNERAGWIPFDQSYPSGHEAPLAHNRCRCDEELRVLD